MHSDRNRGAAVRMWSIAVQSGSPLDCRRRRAPSASRPFSRGISVGPAGARFAHAAGGVEQNRDAAHRPRARVDGDADGLRLGAAGGVNEPRRRARHARGPLPPEGAAAEASDPEARSDLGGGVRCDSVEIVPVEIAGEIVRGAYVEVTHRKRRRPRELEPQEITWAPALAETLASHLRGDAATS